uniref:CENP-V/GFA domain-containing protein n=1 Tax=Ramularia collo-cygni TaxID=112498 RepID=A0A2D3VEM6_9PEZI
MKVYDGSCHCGNIKYTVALNEALAPEGTGIITRCNCSICTKNGYFNVYPRREDVVFENGCDSKLKSYLFGKKRKPHRFCPECSSSILIDFKDSDVEDQRPLLAMNASHFKDIDLANASYFYYDGKTKLDPPYQG